MKQLAVVMFPESEVISVYACIKIVNPLSLIGLSFVQNSAFQFIPRVVQSPIKLTQN